MRNTGGMITPSQINRDQFDKAMVRLAEVLGVKTQIELAVKMGIRQSSVADAKRRGNIPDSWLLKIVCTYHVNPVWIMQGTGSKFLVPQRRSPKRTNVESPITEMPVPALLRALARRLGRADILITE